MLGAGARRPPDLLAKGGRAPLVKPHALKGKDMQPSVLLAGLSGRSYTYIGYTMAAAWFAVGGNYAFAKPIR
jgi:hypothetical protein